MFDLRRKLLQGGAASALLSPLLGMGLLAPVRAYAVEWNRQAFAARTTNEALKIYGVPSLIETRAIVINGPEIAENGAKVEIDITSHIDDTRSLAILADKNPTPLCAILEFSDLALPFARIQLKLAETTRVRIVAKTGDGKTHVAFREIKVTTGGCGA